MTEAEHAAYVRRFNEDRKRRFRRELDSIRRQCVEASLERKGLGRPERSH